MGIPIDRILVPFDFSAGSHCAMEYANALAGECDGEVELLHVVERNPYDVYQEHGIARDADSPPAPLDEPSASVDGMIDGARRELLRIAEAAKCGRHLVAVRHGHAVAEILAEIGRFWPNLIVMSAVGRSGVSDLVLGSVCERVLRLAPVHVLLVRGRPILLPDSRRTAAAASP